MVLTFVKDTSRRTNAELLPAQSLLMDEKRISRSSSNGSSGSPSPPPNNNTRPAPVPTGPNSASSSAASLFSGMGPAAAVAAAASLWQQQMLLAAAAANPLLSRFPHHQNLLQPGWTPPSPPSPLPGPVSPALSNASSGSARGNTLVHQNNNNNSASQLNNNVVSSSFAGDDGEISSERLVGLRKLQSPSTDDQKYVGQKRQRLAHDSAKASSPATLHDSSEPQKKQSTDRGRRFTCSVCNKSFGYKHVLHNHQRTHTKEKPYECPVCHQKFSRDHHMKTHVRLHTGERPYSCSVCSRGFVQVANLRRHMRVHTGERPYSCRTCSMKFSDSNQLKSHQLVHMAKNLFQCEICHKQFRRSQLLVNHKCICASATSAVAPSSSVQKLPQPNSPARPELDDHGETSRDTEMLEMTSFSTSVFTGEPRHVRTAARRAVSAMPSSSFLGIFTTPTPLSPYHISADLPEQTEPTDLSMPRSQSRSNRVNLLMHNNCYETNGDADQRNDKFILTRYFASSEASSRPN